MTPEGRVSPFAKTQKPSAHDTSICVKLVGVPVFRALARSPERQSRFWSVPVRCSSPISSRGSFVFLLGGFVRLSARAGYDRVQHPLLSGHDMSFESACGLEFVSGGNGVEHVLMLLIRNIDAGGA